jgi:hypothetical protein
LARRVNLKIKSKKKPPNHLGHFARGVLCADIDQTSGPRAPAPAPTARPESEPPESEPPAEVADEPPMAPMSKSTREIPRRGGTGARVVCGSATCAGNLPPNALECCARGCMPRFQRPRLPVFSLFSPCFLPVFSLFCLCYLFFAASTKSLIPLA